MNGVSRLQSEVLGTPNNAVFDFIRRHPSEVQHARAQMEVTVLGNSSPAINPIMTFEEACLPGFVLKQFHSENYEKPTPIQAQGWPIALSGMNMVGIARTGSGKTLAVSQEKNNEGQLEIGSVRLCEKKQLGGAFFVRPKSVS